MQKMILLFLGLLGSVGMGAARVMRTGQCNDINFMDNFNLNSFIGTWHELSKSVPTNADCSSWVFTTTNNVITVSNPSVVNNFLQTATGTATYITGEPKLTLTMSPGNPVDFWILNTDYNNYAIVIECLNSGTGQESGINVRLLGKEKNSLNTATTLAQVNLDLAAIGLTVNDLVSVDQSEDACTQLPQINGDVPVVLSGQCNPNINVVQNLEVERFLGTWYEIESYYSENARGDCARADYTLAGGVVNVVNSQVVGQQLERITGIASLTGTDGRLTVTLAVNGMHITQDLFILDTDYNGYAVSYSCINLPNDEREVYSWILSRSQQISAASQIEVNRVIDSYVDLNTAYYRLTAQTDEACFYYPEFQPGVPVIFPGQCDMSIPVQADFDPTLYIGLWHDIESYPSTFQQGTCNNAFYTLTPESTVDVFNTQVVNQRLDTMRGVAEIPDPSQPAKLRVSFPIGNTGGTTSTDYWILSTNYNSYSLVYTCENLPNNERMVFSWKLSRTKALSADAITTINNVIASIPVLDSRYFPERDQTVSGCFYYPEADADEPVVFPGQCDQSISPLSDFNINSFAGVWYEVEAYPKNEQSGTCINHEFTSVTGNANSLNLVSNQIVNQRPTSASGSVSSASNDGSGNLQLTMTVDGQLITFPYWILATDYSSYALAYSCEYNQNDDTSSVYSWKLSKTKTLTPEANQAIDNFVSNIETLREEYYQPISQSDEGCFYVPELVSGQSVLFKGACKQVNGMPEFNAQEYLGWWHEIQRYPTENNDQLGQCTSADFRQTGTAFQVVESGVLKDSDDHVETTSTAVLSADGTITITRSGGSTVWTVLATDYSSYSLLYACENVDRDGETYRRVWSAKHSKSRSLTQAAQNAMNREITANEVLHEELYENVDQSSEACFYYRENAGERVILDGQCNPAIPVQSEFDVNQFSGIWYQHERYPYPEVSNEGTCVGTEYTSNGNIINVQNWEVLDGELNTIRGTAMANAATATLAIILPAEGTQDIPVMNLQILTTDYETYALGYTCVNMGPYRRAVGAFKLSRSREMTEEAKTAIDTYMNDHKEFHESYFIPIDQSADCRGPNSAFLAKSSIIVMLVSIALQLVM